MNKRIKSLLDEKGITQAELAKVAGVSQAFMSYVIKGLKAPSVSVLKRIADYLHVSVDELIDD